jgi:hypothetical protein
MIHGYISCLESKVDRAHTDKILPGADPGFQVRGCTLKNCAEHFWGIRVKNHDFKPKNHIFSNFKGGGEGGGKCACQVRPPPLDPPLITLF